MALTQLSDIIDVVTYQDLPVNISPEKTDVFESGAVIRNAAFAQFANNPGTTGELPFWNDLEGSDEVNYSTDTTSTATPKKIAQGEQIYRKAFVNQGWSEADLAAELAMGGSAMRTVKARVDKYFTRQWQRRLIATSNGILADNVANDSSDMVEDVAVEILGSQTAATKFNSEAFTNAVFTMGDAKDSLTTIAVHSAVLKTMTLNDDIDYMPDSEGKLTIPTYKGLRVIVDDGLTVTAGTTSGFKYTSVIYGNGAFAYGEGTPNVPVEVAREAAQGNGGGVEVFWKRNTWILHPFGFADDGTPATNGFSYTLAEVAAAAAWDRVIERKNIPLAFLITN
jgi:hypothetical protein